MQQISYGSRFAVASTRSSGKTGRWPFPPRPVRSRAGLAAGQSVGQSVGQSAQGMTRRAMLADTCLALVWAAMIPGVLWLGSAAGF